MSERHDWRKLPRESLVAMLESGNNREAQLAQDLDGALRESARQRLSVDAAEGEVARLREELTVRSRRCDTWAADLAAERAAHEATKVELSSLTCHVLNDLVTYAELDAETERASAAEARVAELERENARLIQVNQDFDALVSDLDPPDVLVHWRTDLATLDKLRESFARDVSVHRQASEFAEKGAQAAEARVAELERTIDQYKHDEACNRAGLLLTLDQARGLLERAPRWLTFDGPARDLWQDIYDWLRAHPEPVTATAVTDSRAEQYGTPLSSGDVLHATAAPAVTMTKAEQRAAVEILRDSLRAEKGRGT